MSPVGDFFRDIGLSAAQRRMTMLETRAKRLTSRGGRLSSSGEAYTAHPKKGSYLLTQGSARHSIDNGLAHSNVVDEGMQQSEQLAVKKPQVLEPPPPTPPSLASASREARLKEELDEAKRELYTRVHAFRNELVEDMRSHEVSLMERPTVAELEDPTKFGNVKLFRRHHLKVVVGSDEKEIRKMPNHSKLCISTDIKRSLTKMRENLFQRRLNLAIYEKTIGDWTMPNMRKEVRRRRRKSPTSNQAPATTGLQTSAHVDISAPSDAIPTSTTAAVTSNTAPLAGNFTSAIGEDPP